jgi:energy-coupling factor transport system permease protein
MICHFALQGQIGKQGAVMVIPQPGNGLAGTMGGDCRAESTPGTAGQDMTLGIEDLLKPFEKIGVPSHEIAMLISIALRFIPDLIDETNRIIKAQESRGVDLKEGKFSERIMAILSLIVPLFVSAFQRADDLANAMEARGYQPGETRTRYKVLKMQAADWALVCGAVLLLITMIVLAYVL